MLKQNIESIEMFIRQVKKDSSRWRPKPFPWFRGQSIDKPLIPKLFRKKYDENSLIQRFRLKAKVLGETPDIKRVDEWLFLMQHSGLPTRLLDWTEGALIALFFAVYELPKEDSSPVVWMLHPLRLNEISTGKFEFPLSFTKVGHENFRAAFEKKTCGLDLPVAVHPITVHIRTSVQQSCFTIHGRKEEAIDHLFKDSLIRDRYLIKYEIDAAKREKILFDLRVVGVSYSTLFPDFDGLAKEIEQFT